MKILGLALLLGLISTIATHAQTKLYIDKAAKTAGLTANMKYDHKIFGYAAPDVKSKKLILFSIFTHDVKGNPYNCPLGAYYQTSNLNKGDNVVYVSESGGFVKLNYVTAEGAITPFYIQRQFVAFE